LLSWLEPTPDSEQANPVLIALMVLCCDPLAIALTAAASAGKGKYRKRGFFFMPKDFAIDPAPIARGPGLLTVYGVEHKPTLLLAERLLMRRVPEIAKAPAAEPNHNQRV